MRDIGRGVVAALAMLGGLVIVAAPVKGTDASLAGCNAAAPAVNLGLCIEQKALQGESIAQIALDCGTDAGAVAIALLQSQNASGTKAKAEAFALRDKMQAVQK